MPDRFGKPENFRKGEASNKELEDFSDLSLEEDIQERKHKISTRLPAAREIAEGQFVLSNVSGVVKLHTKVNGVIKSVTMT